MFSISSKNSSRGIRIAQAIRVVSRLAEFTAIYRDSEGIVWIGFSPRALDRIDRKTVHATHYVASLEDRSVSEKGTDVNGIYKDVRGYVWLGGWGSGLDRLDERTRQVKHYRHKPDDPNGLPSNHVIRIYGDRSGQLWVGYIDGVARLDPATEQFTFYHSDPKNPTKYGNAGSFRHALGGEGRGRAEPLR